MIMETLISMTALILIVIILISGGCRTYFRRKFDASVHLRDVDAAIKRQANARRELHNVK